MEAQKTTTKRRKRRTDRNHVIYLLTCKPTGETYVGITVARGRAYKASMMKRWQGHLYHANIEMRTGLLQQAIREHGSNCWTHEILCVVRGKAAVHKRELELITEHASALNVEGTGRKQARRTRAAMLLVA